MSDPEPHDPDGLQLSLLIDVKGAAVLALGLVLVSVAGWHPVLMGVIFASLVIEGYALVLTAGILRRRFSARVARFPVTTVN